MRKILILIFLNGASIGFSQQQKKNAFFTIRGNIGIPKSVSSQMFRTAFNGVYEGNLSVNFRTFSNFFVGVGYQNSHFQNNKKVFAYYQSKTQNGNSTGAFLSYNTRMIGHAGFFKLGYDQFFDKGYVSYSINTGMMMTNYQNVEVDTNAANKPYVSKVFNAPYVQPELAVHFLADRALSFSIMFSYTTMFYKFDPKAPRFNAIEQVVETRNKYVMSWINLGFGFNIHIHSKN